MPVRVKDSLGNIFKVMIKSILTKLVVIGGLLAAIVVLFKGESIQKEFPTRIILDTDISSDVDDVGAVSVLHALADQKKAQILAMMVSSGDPWSAPCLDALNTWFGRPNIPIGMIKGSSVQHKSKYTTVLSTEFPHDLKSGDVAPDAVTLYRQILAKQADSSVTLVSIGYLTNIKNLIESPSDEYSPLDGKSLVRKKVKRLVCMGGQYPKGREWNFHQDTVATKTVLMNWPAPITFCGFEVGRNVMTGAFPHSDAATHPVRRAYQLYNEITERPSWDQVTVLYAVEGNTGSSGVSWHASSSGYNDLDADGGNQWIKDPKGMYNYLSLDTSPQKTAEIINKLMLGAVSR